MLDDFFSDPASADRLRSCALGGHVDAFYKHLVELGYRPSTIGYKLWAVGRLAGWMTGRHMAVADLDERRIEEFVDARQSCGQTWRGLRGTLLQFLEQLRSSGSVPRAESVPDESAAAVMLARYEGYLRRERGLAESTVTGYRRFVQAFIHEHLDGGLAGSDTLRSEDVRDSLLARAHLMIPKRAQFMATALRSFMQFLFLRGETEMNLALAAPTVRRWHLSGIPRHLPTEDVEQLLRACNRSSPTGRRNHAVLLLIARLGLRASEVVTLELADVRWREGEIVVRGKGKLHDRLPLLADVGEAIALYLSKDRPACECRRVFLCMGAPHRGFSHPSTVSTIVARTLARAGLEPPTRGAHLLRHSLATTMVRNGASFAEIGQVLRHRSPNTTEIYAKLDFDTLRDVALPWPVEEGAA